MGPRRRLPAPLLLLLVLAAGFAVLRRSSGPAPPAAEEERPDLHPWDLTGCWELRVEPWELEPVGAARAPDSVPAFLRPPTRVMLVPDSVDEWRRVMTTYRAAPLAGEGHELLDGHMRWFVRADTLWLVWSDRLAGAAVALRASDGRFAGSARAFSQRDSLDGTARAAARKINCATLEPEVADDAPAR